MTGIKLAPVSGYLCGWLPRWALAVGLLLALAGCGNLETAAHESDFFRNRLGTDGVRHSGPFSISPVVTAKYLRLFEAQFRFAVHNLPYPDEDADAGTFLTDELGQHLFIYYFWGMYPLKGENSLLERFFQKTSGQPARWAALFRTVGFILRNAAAWTRTARTDS